MSTSKIDMINLLATSEMTPAYGAVLVILNIFAIALVLVTLNIDGITACVSRMVKRLHVPLSWLD